MSKEIKPTDEPIYWVARDDEGNVLHSGVTNPGQVTTTGQNNLITGTKENQVQELEKYIGARPGEDYEFDEIKKKWYKDKLKVKTN